jgi:hypothetical protein
MNKNLNKIAEELFNKIRSQFSNITLGNDEAEIIEEPADARYYEFDFEYKNQSLGSITISLDQDDGLVLMFSNDIIKDQPDGVKHRWFNFLKEMREFAKRRLLNFEARDILKSLDDKDYSFLSKNRKENQMNESKLWGTNKTSYQNVDEARIVVKHSKPINGEIPQGRTHGIDSIFIENSQGERFKYPYKHLNGARAMARHIANSGNPYDNIGTYITGLSEELSKLRMFKGYVGRNPVVSEAMDTVQSKVTERIDGIKKQIQQLHGQTFYENFSKSFAESEYQEIPEEIMNDWIDKLTIRVFNEDLTSAFPYIYKIMNNTKIETLNPADFSTEQSLEESSEEGIDVIENSIMEYEKYIDSIVEEADIFSDPKLKQQAIDDLNELFQQPLLLGADGTNAIESLKGIIKDDDLFRILDELVQDDEFDNNSDIRQWIVEYIKLHDAEMAAKIEIPEGESTPSPEPEAAPAPEPAQPPATPQPVADSIQRFAKIVERAIMVGATPSDVIPYKGQHVALKDAIIMSGLNVEDFFQDNDKESNGKIVEYVKSMYDRHTGTFPKGETGVILAVEKQFGKPATKIASEAMKNLRHVYESERMKRLAGI